MSSPTAVTDRLARTLAITLALGMMAAGCVTTGMRAGQLAEQGQDYDRAVVEYTRVLKEHPDNREARLSLDRAKLRAALEHYNRGLRLRNGGRLDEALVELQIASELNPASGDIDSALAETRSQLRTKVAVTREGKTQLETLIDRSRDLPPLGVDLPADAKVPAVLTFRDASARDVFTALGRFASVNVVFDPTYRDQPVTIDLRNSTLEAALQAVSASTRNFYRVTAQRTITVVPDTPAKRREYEEEVVRTFFLSNADLKETMDMLRVVVDIRRVATSAATNAITIKDTPERIAAASRIITAVDKARPEVVIDVELLEVDRTRLRDYGLQLASPGDPTPIGIDGAASINREGGLTVRDLRSLSQSSVVLTNLPGLYFRLLKSDHNTRTLANPQLRTSEGIAAQAKFGERVPVPVTTFSPIAAGGVQSQPITSFNYENIGVNIDITPRTHHDDNVTLAIKVGISSISGTGFGGLPTFGNREINTVIRLKDGETNLMAGLIRDDERRTLEGVPGLVDIPVLGRLFARSRKESQETDIVMTLTPRIVRVLDLSESDVRAFKVGRDGDGGGPIELPIPAALPPPAAPPAAAPPAAPPAGAPPAGGGANPILPPK
jgi:general secretion pathway protein D